MHTARQIALGTLAAGIGACNYPEYILNGSSGSSGSSGTFIPNGSSGTSGDPPTCKATHPGGGTCEYTPGAMCGCSGDEKCSVVDEATGRSACTRAGPTKAHEKCGSDSDCMDGTFCEPLTRACATICQNLNDCTQGAQCIPAQSANGTVIPGLKLRTAHCEPVSTAPCGSNLNCFYRDALAEFDCASSLRAKEDQVCKSDLDCDKGLLCLTSTSSGGICQPWCKPANSTNGNGCPKAKPRCAEIATAVEYNGVAYGVCLK